MAVRAHGADEDEPLPIWSGRFEAPDPTKLHPTAKLGGKTLGEELGEYQARLQLLEGCLQHKYI